MQLAVLGTDEDIRALALAAREGGHEIVWLGEVRPEEAAAFEQLAPGATRGSPWEVLLDPASADAVLVGRGTASEDLRLEQLKRLASNGVPMLVVHPISCSVLAYYELDMLQRETGGTMLHFNPLANHPALARFAEIICGGHDEVGVIVQVSCLRHATDRTHAGVLGQLARDAELLAAVAGNIRQVAAVGPRPADASYASLQVQMTSSVASSLRWSIAPPRDATTGVELTLVGERGVITAHFAAEEPDSRRTRWQVETLVGHQRHEEPPLIHDPAKAAIARLADALHKDNAARHASLSTWPQATRSMEVVDAVELSLQKGRTIEVHQQQLTEQTAFRGTMAALGCGLLMIGFLVVVAVALLGGVETFVEQPLLQRWPVALLTILVFFLLLQTVPMLTAKQKQPASTPSDSNQPLS